MDKFKPIYRNLQHVPRIWGVTFAKMFASLFGGLFIMVSLLQLARPVVAFPGSVAVFGFLYGGSFYLDSRDRERLDTSFIRRHLTAYSLSHQRVRITK